MRTGWLWIFPIVGVLLMAGAAAIQVNRISDQASMTRTEGRVVDITDGCPTVEFSTASGEAVMYESTTCSKPPSFDVGETVPMFYDPQSPGDARIDGFIDNWLGTLIVGGIGVMFTLIGSLFVIPGVLSKRRAAELAVSGQPVEAEIVDVQLNESFKINGRSPWKITAQWQNPATNKLHIFSSDNIWFDPSRFLPELNLVRVLIDPQNPKRYSMDISFLPDVVD